jgi:hypothetical protein
MTTLGKILVFVNLVLSLFIMALIVSVYIGRTDWHRAYDEVITDRKVANQNTQTAIDEVAKRDAVINQLTQQVQQDQQILAKAQADAAAQLAREHAQVELKDQQIAQLNINRTTERQELQASQKEKDVLRDRVAALDKELNAANLHVQESDNARVDAEINLRKTQDRNERLLAENERLNKDVVSAKNAALNAGTASNSGKRRPPTEDVEGVVKSTDAQSGYITITIGSDAGLNKGDTLEVYRLKPDAAYLGTVEIIAVRADQAVAKPMGRLRGAIQVGDRVSSNIVTKR